MSDSNVLLSMVCWNVRGLGDKIKCDIVKNLFQSNQIDLVLLQETKH